MICGRVEGNEDDWRPLGPRSKYFNASGYREASFDAEAFAVERPRTLHTIPSDMLGDGNYAGSRVWTCDVKTWRSWQTKATREANKEEAAAGGPAAATPAKSVSREKQFEQVLASDPVWKKIAVSRETPGPVRPVTEAEKEQLGTRAEFQEVSYSGPSFWKILQKGNPDDVYDWQNDKGGHVPPWFPDLKECQRCTIGAAYAKGKGEYSPLSKTTLVCFNRKHYQEKLQVGEADYKAKLEAQRKGLDRQDLKEAESYWATCRSSPRTHARPWARHCSRQARFSSCNTLSGPIIRPGATRAPRAPRLVDCFLQAWSMITTGATPPRSWTRRRCNV